MALTINPAVGRKRHDWLWHGATFTAGVALGATVALLAVTIVTRALEFVSRDLALAAGTVAIAWAVLHDLGVKTWLPYRQTQVPEAFRDLLPPSVVAFVFGVMLGAGFLTFFTYSIQLAVLVALPYLGGGALLALAAFSLGKSVVLLTAVGAQTVDHVGARFHWTAAGNRLLRGTSATLSLLLVLLLIAIVG
jgi:hypothetical protein